MLEDVKPMGRKKILIFIDWFLPGFKAGGPVRSIANMVDHLSNDFCFYIITRNTEYLEDVPYDKVVSDQWNDFSSGVKVFYCNKQNASLITWRKLINEVQPDTIYINGVYSFKFSLMSLLAAKLQKAPGIIVAPRGMLASSAINVKRFRKKTFLSITRLLGLFKNVLWHVTNEKEEQEVVQTLNRKGLCFVAPNLPKKGFAPIQIIAKEPGMVRLCSLARVSPEKNTLFAIQCLLEIKTNIRIVFDLYGQIYNTEYWKQCEAAILKLPANVKINYMGVVAPERIIDTVSQYHALFLPSAGENFGHVILESFMSGRLAIISDQTPWHQLKERNAGWDLPLCDKDEFTRVIEQLAGMNQIDYDHLCKGAYDIALEVVNDKVVLEAYLKMFGKDNND